MDPLQELFCLRRLACFKQPEPQHQIGLVAHGLNINRGRGPGHEPLKSREKRQVRVMCSTSTALLMFSGNGA